MKKIKEILQLIVLIILAVIEACKRSIRGIILHVWRKRLGYSKLRFRGYLKTLQERGEKERRKREGHEEKVWAIGKQRKTQGKQA